MDFNHHFPLRYTTLNTHSDHRLSTPQEMIELRLTTEIMNAVVAIFFKLVPVLTCMSLKCC